MGFSQKVVDEAFIRCRRHCCICDEFKGQNIELHHIVPKANGGSDEFDNAIPLCFDCHAMVGSYNAQHPRGRKYSENELKKLRDICYSKYGAIPQNISPTGSIDIFNSWFERGFNNNGTAIWGYKIPDFVCRLHKGDINLISGYTGIGKSRYVQNVVATNLKKSKKVVYCNLKDSAENVLNNIMSLWCNINAENLRNKELTAEDWEKLSVLLPELQIENLKFVPYSTSHNADDIVSIVMNSNADIVVIDDFTGLNISAENQASFMYNLKSAASVSGTIVLIVYNISKNFNKKCERVDFSKFPNDIYRFCDIVKFINPHYEDYFDTEDKTKLEVVIAKNYVNGSCMTFFLEKSEKSTAIYNIDYD